jgi:hypothetical protein
MSQGFRYQVDVFSEPHNGLKTKDLISTTWSNTVLLLVGYQPAFCIRCASNN